MGDKRKNWNLAENPVPVFPVGDGFPVPVYSSPVIASPNHLGAGGETPPLRPNKFEISMIVHWDKGAGGLSGRPAPTAFISQALTCGVAFLANPKVKAKRVYYP